MVMQRVDADECGGSTVVREKKEKEIEKFWGMRSR